MIGRIARDLVAGFLVFLATMPVLMFLHGG